MNFTLVQKWDRSELEFARAPIEARGGNPRVQDRLNPLLQPVSGPPSGFPVARLPTGVRQQRTRLGRSAPDSGDSVHARPCPFRRQL